jgi:hypothetical protein
VRAPARAVAPEHPHVGVPRLRRPARPGPQRRTEHPGGRSCRGCLWSRCQPPWVLPGAVGGEAATPAGDRWNPGPPGQGVVKPPS